MKFVLVFIILLMVIGINLPKGLMAGFDYDTSWLIAALAAWVVTALVIHRRMALIVLVLAMAFLVNLPVNIGIDRDVILGTLLAVIVTPYVASWLE